MSITPPIFISSFHSLSNIPACRLAVEIDSDGEEVICTGISSSNQNKKKEQAHADLNHNLKRKEPLFFPPTPEKNVSSSVWGNERATKRRKSGVVSEMEDEGYDIIDDPRTVILNAPAPSTAVPPITSRPYPSPQKSQNSSHTKTLNQVIDTAIKNDPITPSSLIGQASSTGPTEQVATTIPSASSLLRDSLPLRLKHAAVIQDHWNINPQNLVHTSHMHEPLSLSSLQMLAQMASDGIPLKDVREYLQVRLALSDGVDGNAPQTGTELVRELKREMGSRFPRSGKEVSRRKEDAAGPSVVENREMAEPTAPVLAMEDRHAQTSPHRKVASDLPAERGFAASRNKLMHARHQSPQASTSTSLPKSPSTRKVPRRAREVDELEDPVYVQMPFQPPSQQEIDVVHVAQTSLVRPRANLSIFKSKKGTIFPFLGVSDPSSRATDKGKGKEARRSPAPVVHPTASPRTPKPANRPFWRTIDDGEETETITDSTPNSVTGAPGATMSPAMAAMTSLNMTPASLVQETSGEKPLRGPTVAFVAPEPALNEALRQTRAEEKKKLEISTKEAPESSNAVVSHIQQESMEGVSGESSGMVSRIENEHDNEPTHRANRVARKSVAGTPRLIDPTSTAETSNSPSQSNLSFGDADQVAGPSKPVPDDTRRPPSMERQAARVKSARKTTGSSLPRATLNLPASADDKHEGIADRPDVEMGSGEACDSLDIPQPSGAVQQTVVAEPRLDAALRGPPAAAANIAERESHPSSSEPHAHRDKRSRIRPSADEYPDWIAQAPPIFLPCADDTQVIMSDIPRPGPVRIRGEKAESSGFPQQRKAMEIESASAMGIEAADAHPGDLPASTDRSNTAPALPCMTNNLQPCVTRPVVESEHEKNPIVCAEPVEMEVEPSLDKAVTFTIDGEEKKQPRTQQSPSIDLPAHISAEDSIDFQLDHMVIDEINLDDPEPTLTAQLTTESGEGTKEGGEILHGTSIAPRLPEMATTLELPLSNENATATPAEIFPPLSASIIVPEVDGTTISINPSTAQSSRDVETQVLSTVPRTLHEDVVPGFSAADYLPDEGRLTRRGAAMVQAPPVIRAVPADRLKSWEAQLMLHNDTTLSYIDARVVELDSRSENGVVAGEQDTKLPDPSLRTRNALQSVSGTPVLPSQSATSSADPDPDMAAFQRLSFERFGDPLLNRLNALAKSAGESDIVRTVMEAYISHACQKEKASDITIAPGIIRKGGSVTRAPPPEFVYSNEVIYMDGVPPRIPSKGCKCIGPCRENSDCFCLKRQEKYFQSFVIEGGPGYTGFACHEDGTIKDAQYPTWECSDECECPPSCRNRVMQRGRDKNVQLEIFETRQKGWGVKTKSSIKRGTFVGIYAGELIPEIDTDARGMIYGKVGRTYLFDLDHWHISQPPADLAEIDPEGAALAMEVARQLCKEEGSPDNIDGASLFTVDAFHWGFTRYLNHSCDPNLQLGSVYYDDFDVRKPRLCITAKRDILAGQELTISYFGPADDDMVEGTTQVTTSVESKEKPNKLHKPHLGSAHVAQDDGQQRACLCKARNCRGTMFN